MLLLFVLYKEKGDSKHTPYTLSLLILISSCFAVVSTVQSLATNTMHFIEEVFGSGCNLYEVLSCPVGADQAELRKKYYRAALKYHPDRNGGNDDANKQFQAISMCYQILHDAESRADYDESGVIPDDAPDEEAAKSGSKEWKQYFDQIFGKVTRSDIEAFAVKYKCSDEERRDVLKEFTARKGNLVKMLDFVMLSEPRDAIRWCEDYLVPAMDEGKLDTKYKSTMEKTLKQCQKKAEKENQQDDDDDDDDEETETEEEEEAEMEVVEEEEEEEETPKKRKATKKKSAKEPPKKGKATKAKAKKKGGNDMSDLVAQIQTKNRGGGGNVFASLGARYGVSVDDDNDDPLNDAEFERIQSKMKKNKKQRK